jgi:hypothetical protein
MPLKGRRNLIYEEGSRGNVEGVCVLVNRPNASMSKAGILSASPWKYSMYSSSGSISHAYIVFGVKTHMPKSSWRATKLYMWSKLVTGSPNSQTEQEEHIPLASPRPVPRVDSAISLCKANKISNSCDRGHVEPLVFRFHLEGRIHVKHLDYPAFARWENVMALLDDLESDGVVIERLWDVREDMAICSGDWDARVRPGLEVNVDCRQTLAEDVRRGYSPRSRSDQDDEAVAALERDDSPLLRKHWWFERWRRKVEQETLTGGGAVREPSRRMLVLGAVSMAAFLGVVVVFCTI